MTELLDRGHDGIDHETSKFAVNSIGARWKRLGRERYPNAKTLTITDDCGGSNNIHTRLWNAELQELAKSDRPGDHHLSPSLEDQQVERDRASSASLRPTGAASRLRAWRSST